MLLEVVSTYILMIVVTSMFLFRSLNPASIILFWVFLSIGFPRGFPAEVFAFIILGALASSVISFLKVMHTVLIPAFSIYLEISPTDWLQRTHVGVMKAICTPISLSLLPTFFAFLMRGSVS